MGIATVITSGKGGVGKSTVTVGLGRALAQRGKRVLLVDCDAGLRSLDRMTGVEEGLVFDAADVVFARCAPAEAIYPCGGTEGLFLLPAPARGEDLVRPRVMEQLVPLLKRYFDHVLLDSPAGVGTGFRAAASGADRALLVCSPDPVCVRGAAMARELLRELGVEEVRLAVNRFSKELFVQADAYPDLDAVIDGVGARLLGVIPEDSRMATSLLRGEVPSADFPAVKAMLRMAGRLEGETIPLAGLA